MATGTIKQAGWSIFNSAFTPASGYVVYGDQLAFKHGSLIWLRISITKSDQSAFAQTRHTVGTISSAYRPKVNKSVSIPASNNINSFLTRITNVIITSDGNVIIDCYQNNDVKQISLDVIYVGN